MLQVPVLEDDSIIYEIRRASAIIKTSVFIFFLVIVLAEE
jgi:hypothetical protein